VGSSWLIRDASQKGDDKTAWGGGGIGGGGLSRGCFQACSANRAIVQLKGVLDLAPEPSWAYGSACTHSVHAPFCVMHNMNLCDAQNGTLARCWCCCWPVLCLLWVLQVAQERALAGKCGNPLCSKPFQAYTPGKYRCAVTATAHTLAGPTAADPVSTPTQVVVG
jgi:hypothetical protein